MHLDGRAAIEICDGKASVLYTFFLSLIVFSSIEGVREDRRQADVSPAANLLRLPGH